MLKAKFLNKSIFIFVLIILLSFRIIYGLFGDFWFEDELQIYLIGLKYYTTGLWPYYGPDVVYTKSQIPGALQAILVGLPLYIKSIPEAPTIFLNLISFASLSFFAWYAEKRIPDFPKLILWVWLLTAPWVLFFSTKVVNPSYVLPFSILFFIGVFELMPIYDKNVLSLNLAAFFVGFSITTIMQLHLSWILLMPITMAAFLFRYNYDSQAIKKPILFCFLGMCLGALTLVPTILNPAIRATGGSEENVVFNAGNIKNLITFITRFLSFASFEIPYMLGSNTEKRISIIKEYIWMAPFTIILLITGWVQVAFFVISFFKKSKVNEWRKLKWFTFFIMVLIYLSFFFSIKGPSSHTFYFALPLVMFYSLYCYKQWFFQYKYAIKISYLLLISGLIFNTGLGLYNYKHKSLYKNREIVEKAIRYKNYKILGQRRSDEWGYGY